MRPEQREAWQDTRDAPDIRVLWDKSPIARRDHLCAHCDEPISVGERYSSTAYIIDGEFKYEKTHRWAYQYPSGCPKFRARDLVELAKSDDL